MVNNNRRVKGPYEKIRFGFNQKRSTSFRSLNPASGSLSVSFWLIAMQSLALHPIPIHACMYASTSTNFIHQEKSRDGKKYISASVAQHQNKSLGERDRESIFSLALFNHNAFVGNGRSIKIIMILWGYI